MSPHVTYAGSGARPSCDYARPNAMALLLAADRDRHDPVAAAAGVACKALAPIAGRAMVLRVLDALAGCPAVAHTLLCGPAWQALRESPALVAQVEGGAVGWIAPRDTPSASAEVGLGQLDTAAPVLMTTADHALLTPPLINAFWDAVIGTDWDVAVGLVPHALVTTGFPGTRRTATRLRDDAYCGTNLFAVCSTQGRRLVSYWRRIEHARKRPWRTVAGALGPVSFLEYAVGALTLERALARLSRRLGLRVGAVILPYAEAGVDVDTPTDLAQVEAALRHGGMNRV